MIWWTRSMPDRATRVETSSSDVPRRHQPACLRLAAAATRLGSGSAPSIRPLSLSQRHHALRDHESRADYESALAEVDRLWGARSGTAEGDRLDVLATLIDAYEGDVIQSIHPTRSRRSKFRIRPHASNPGLW